MHVIEKKLCFSFFPVPSEEVIIRKERAAGSYRLSAYYFGKCLSEVPLVICYPILFLFVFYWLCGLNPSVAFLGQALTLVINAVLAQVYEIIEKISKMMGSSTA